MSRYTALKAIINQDITTNGQGDITGAVLNQVLKDMVDSLGAYYQFGGIATPTTNPGNPDQRVFYIATIAGTYTNFGSLTVPNGISFLKFDESWSLETLDLSTYINNVVSNGVVVSMIQDATELNAIPSVDGKIYNDYNAGDIFYIEENDVRKYRVALTAGTADAEHPVTIAPAKFYYALNSADAINLSLTLKTVSTEQQSLSAQQKAMARTNIAAVSYDQQSLNADQQVQTQNNILGKVYSSTTSEHSGLGKVYIQKNNGVLTQAMINTANTVYVIQYDYTLAANITIPANCTLEFDGGSISGDGSGKNTITGNSTTVTNKVVGVIFNNIILDGSFVASQIFADWFSDSDDYRLLSSLFKFSGNITLSRGKTYSINNGVVIGSNTSVDCNGATIAIRVTGKTAVFIARATTVEIYNGSIIGNGITAESNEEYGIYVLDSKNVNITDMYISAFSRDGIYIGYAWNSTSDTNHIQDIFIRRCVIDAVARNGVSVASGDNVLIDNCTFKNITSFAPRAGVDVEPETGVSGKRLHINNVNITNCKAYNCGNSVQVYSAGFTYNPGSVFIDNLHAELNCKLNIVNSKPNAGLSTFVNNVTFVNPSHNAILVRNPSDASQVVLNNIHVSGYIEKRSAAGISYENGNYGMITIFAQKNTGSTDRTDIGGVNISNVFLSIKDGGALFDNIIAIGYQAEEYSGGQHIFTPLPIKNVRISNINAPEVQVKKNGYVSVKNMLNTSKYALTQNTLKYYHPASAWRRVAIINGSISFRANIQAVYTDYASQAFTADVSIQSFASSIVLSNNVGGNQIDSVRVAEEDNVKYLEVHNNKTGQIQYFITFDQSAADAVMGIKPTAATETETIIVTQSFSS